MNAPELLTVGGLFSGIGGLEYGLELSGGFRTEWHCEADGWCRRVLAKHWRDVACYDDVRAIDETAPRVDVIAGGFPCQPVSLAGRGLAQADERWLWPEFARVVRLLRPRYVVVENVPGLLARGMGDVLGDLAACGYDAEWDCIGAADVGAHHRRKRVWVVAYPKTNDESRGMEVTDSRRSRQRRPLVCAGAGAGSRVEFGDLAARGDESRPDRVASGASDVADAGGERWLPGRHDAGQPQEPEPVDRGAPSPVADAEGEPERARLRAGGPRIFRGRRPGDVGSARDAWAVEPDVGRVAHGIPRRVDRLRGLGNAVVPQVAEYIGRLILEAEVTA